MFYLCVLCACYLYAGHEQSLFLSGVIQVSGPGCAIIIEVFLGNPCIV